MRCILTVNYSPWSSYSGGGQRSTHNLACALARRGHRVTVVFTKRPWERVQLPADLPYDVVWATMALARRTTPFFVAKEARRLINATDSAMPVIVHGNGEESALIGELKRRASTRRFGFVVTPRYPNFPSVLQHDVTEQSPLALALMTVAQTKYAWLGRALRNADWICPTSRSAADMVQRAYGLDRARMTVVPNGISEEFLRTPNDDSITLDAGLRDFVARGDFAIYFGRIVREKGVHTLIEALAHPAASKLRVVFAGRGPALDEIQARAHSLGIGDRVLFSTWLDAKQLSSLVRRASFAVLPSLEESFGNTMAESMALSVPVISTTAGSIPELITHERTGVLVAPEDHEALARAMASLADNAEQRARLGAAGRTHVERNLTWDASAAAFETIYERVAGT